MRVRCFVLIGCSMFGACGLEGEADSGGVGGAVEQRRSPLLSYVMAGVGAGRPDAGIGDGPVVAAKFISASGAYVRGGNNRLIDCDQQSTNTNVICSWTSYETWQESESFAGRPSAVALDGLGDTVFVKRTTGTIGYDQHTGGPGEFGAQPWNSNWYEIPSSSIVAGNPAASGTGSSSSLRYDVFGRTSSNTLAWVTGTGAGYGYSNSPYWTPPTWGTWTTDTGVTLLSGTDPAAVVLSLGRIDVVVCDSSNNLRLKTFSSGSWSAWSTVASGCYSTPSIAGYQTLLFGGTTTHLAVAALNSAGQHQVVTGSQGSRSFSWSGWSQLSSAVLSAPSLQRVSAAGVYRIWGKGTDGNAYYAEF